MNKPLPDRPLYSANKWIVGAGVFGLLLYAIGLVLAYQARIKGIIY